MKWWTIFRQRVPLIRLAQMGHRRRICLKGQKKSLTVRRRGEKIHSNVYPPPPTFSILTHRSQRGGGGRVQQVCLPSLGSFFGAHRASGELLLLTTHSTHSASTRAVIYLNGGGGVGGVYFLTHIMTKINERTCKLDKKLKSQSRAYQLQNE